MKVQCFSIFRLVTLLPRLSYSTVAVSELAAGIIIIYNPFALGAALVAALGAVPKKIIFNLSS